MNENDQINALLGTKKADPAAGGSEDWKAKYESLKAEYDEKRPMLGRVSELSEKDKRIAALEKELSESRANRKASTIAGSLSAEERGDIPDEYVGIAAKVAAKATDDVMTGVNEELAQLRREREAEKAEAQRRMKLDFIQRIQEKYPKFLEEIAPGGAKAQSWNAFLEYNQESVNTAFNTCDFKSLVYHVDRFYREVLGVRPPTGGQGGSSVPDPVTHDGGSPAVSIEDPNKTYTQEEYNALEQKAMNLRAAGDFKGYKAIRGELDNILSERRLK